MALTPEQVETLRKASALLAVAARQTHDRAHTATHPGADQRQGDRYAAAAAACVELANENLPSPADPGANRDPRSSNR